jgi:hypothetical protein
MRESTRLGREVRGVLGGRPWRRARRSLPTQQTGSTAGPLYIMYSPKRLLLGRESWVSAGPYHSAYARSCGRPPLIGAHDS